MASRGERRMARKGERETRWMSDGRAADWPARENRRRLASRRKGEPQIGQQRGRGAGVEFERGGGRKLASREKGGPQIDPQCRIGKQY